jgi:hypothetical protein
MMKPRITATALALILGFGVGLPARAGELNVVDPAGDATGFDLINEPTFRSTPRPSGGELDILGLKAFTDGKDLKFHLKLAKVAHPTGSAGFSYRVNFTHGGKAYHFLHQVLGPPGAETVSFFFRQGSTVIECRCSGKVNGKSATLEITAEIASLGRALKANGTPQLGPGTKLTNVYGTTDRIVGFLVAVDRVEPPANTTFTV